MHIIYRTYIHRQFHRNSEKYRIVGVCYLLYSFLQRVKEIELFPSLLAWKNGGKLARSTNAKHVARDMISVAQPATLHASC